MKLAINTDHECRMAILLTTKCRGGMPSSVQQNVAPLDEKAPYWQR